MSGSRFAVHLRERRMQNVSESQEVGECQMRDGSM